MYLFKIDHNNSQYTKFSPWTSHMETSQHVMTSILNTLISLRMKQWWLRCHLINSVFVRKPMDNFVMSLPLFSPLSNLPFCITALYTKNTHSISARCSLQIRKTQLSPSVWILTTPPSATTTAITLICPGETSKFVTIQKPIHILQLPPPCSATMPNFHIPPHYENLALEVHFSQDMANLNMINISSLDFCILHHLEKHQNESQLQHLASIPSVPVEQPYRHMAKGIQHIKPLTSPEESTGDTASIWTLFSHT